MIYCPLGEHSCSFLSPIRIAHIKVLTRVYMLEYIIDLCFAYRSILTFTCMRFADLFSMRLKVIYCQSVLFVFRAC